MSIIDAVYSVVFESLELRKVVKSLLSRDIKSEMNF